MRGRLKTDGGLLDLLFSLALLCVFAATVLSVLLTGAQVYRGITAQAAERYNRTTALSYLIAKTRRCDLPGAVAVGEFDGQPALLLSEDVNGEHFVTYLYYYDGALRELFTRPGSAVSAAGGQAVLDSGGVAFSLDGGLLTFTCIDPDSGAVSTASLYLRSAGGGETP